jgi:molecular chaperone DnaK (HSP70)
MRGMTPLTNSSNSLIVGIDLGTTNSLVAIVKEGVPVVIPDPKTGATLLPSVVYFPPNNGAVIVGEAALPFLHSDPENTLYSTKRLMGKGVGDGLKAARDLAYTVTQDAQIAVRGRDISAPEVAAQVLFALKQRAESYLGVPVAKAVITVPAYFNDAERQATKDAGEMAGLDVIRIVNEPTAASLAYGLQNKKEATIAVYDLGGGTFDISILRLSDGLFEVLATGGDTRLGGDDFDNAIVDWFLENVTTYPRTQVRLAAEKAKRELSEYQSTEILGVAITRPQFEAIVAPLIKKTLATCQQTLTDAGLNIAQIAEVVLVGGSTRVPAVREAVGNLFGKTPHTHLNPDEVVALGAALQADILSGNRDDLLLSDVTPLSLGIETMGGATERLIFRNAKIPCTAKEEFTTSVEGQTKVLLHVVQGEREMAADCRSLARIELTGIPPLPAGIPKIEVRFLLDANGILQVSAKELRSGVKTDVRIKPTYGIAAAEIKERVRESFRHADTDFTARMIADMKNEANAAILGAQKLLVSHGNQIEISEKASIEAALAELIAIRDTATIHSEIREKMNALDAAAAPLAEAAMSGIARNLVAGKTLDQALEDLAPPAPQ